MTISSEPVKGWQQLSLIQSGPKELILRVGTFPEADHAQFQVELRDAGSKELLALASRPHVPWCDAQAELEDWLAVMREHLVQLDQPFG
jgi:hypothetical protein